MLDFRAIASKKLEDIERPKNAPVGDYLWAITKVPAIETLPNDAWDVVDFQLKCIAAVAVDADALAEWGGDLSKLRLRHRFMFSKTDPVDQERSVWRLRDFMENHVKTATSDMTLTEAMNSTVNGQFVGGLAWQQDKRDESLFHMNIGKTAPVA